MSEDDNLRSLGVQEGDIGGQYSALRFDIEEYQKLLDAPEITEEQQKEFLTTLWRIMVAFVDLGFGIDPVQQALDKSGSTHSLLPLDAVKLLSCEDRFSRSASNRPVTSEKRTASERKDS